MCLFKKEYITLNKSELEANDLFVHKIAVKPKKRTIAVINPTYNAIFIKDGLYQNVLSEGEYPIINKGEKHISNVELIFASKTAKVEVKWGTPNRLEMMTQSGLIKLGIRGAFEVQICDPRKAYLEIIELDKGYNIEKLQTRLRARMCNEIQPLMAKVVDDLHLTYDQADDNKDAIADLIKPTIKNIFGQDYGLDVVSFAIDAIMAD